MADESADGLIADVAASLLPPNQRPGDGEADNGHVDCEADGEAESEANGEVDNEISVEQPFEMGDPARATGASFVD
jgi:hypothetical protein